MSRFSRSKREKSWFAPKTQNLYFVPFQSRNADPRIDCGPFCAALSLVEREKKEVWGKAYCSSLRGEREKSSLEDGRRAGWGGQISIARIPQRDEVMIESLRFIILWYVATDVLLKNHYVGRLKQRKVSTPAENVGNKLRRTLCWHRPRDEQEWT